LQAGIKPRLCVVNAEKLIGRRVDKRSASTNPGPVDALRLSTLRRENFHGNGIGLFA
jgi:hypothetical protein